MENVFTRTMVPLICVGGLNLLAGLIFQAIVAGIYGASGPLEAFYMADAVPGFLNDRLLFGAVNIVLVPLLCSERLRRNFQESWHIANTFISLLTILSLLFTSLCCLCAPYIVHYIAPGFSPSKASLTVNLLRLLSMTTLFFATASCIRGILHAHNIFIVPYLGGLVYYTFLTVFILMVSKTIGIWALGLGAVFASAIFCAIHLLPLRNITLAYRFSIDPSVVRGPLTLFFSYMFISTAAHINYLADRYFASKLSEGSIVILSLAQKFEIPIIFLATFSISLPALTIFSNAAGNEEQFRNSLRNSIRSMSVVAIPLLALLLSIRLPLAQLWLQHGSFTHEDCLRVASIVSFLFVAFLVDAYAALVLNSYFSLRAIKLCLVVSVGEVALNIYLNYVLVGPLGLEGIALATSISSALASVVLWGGLRSKLNRLGFRGDLSEFRRLIAFCILMASSFFIVRSMAEAFKPGYLEANPLHEVTCMVCVGLILFPLLGTMLRIPEIRELHNLFKHLVSSWKKGLSTADTDYK